MLRLNTIGVLAAISLVCSGSAHAGEMVLRVLSYNIQGLPWPVSYRHDRYRKIGERLAKRRAEGNAPHIVALQEAFTGRTKELNQAAGYPHQIKGPKGSGIRVNSGLRILSEFPFDAAVSEVYSSCSGTNCLSRKGVVMARISLPGVPQSLDFYTTHMDATTEWTDAPTASRMRLRQLRQLGFFMRKYTPRGTPMIFPGDFNFRYPSPEGDVVARDLGLLNATAVCSADPLCRHDEDPGEELQRSVDHQLFVPGFGVTITPIWFERNFEEIVDGVRLSDHLGHEVHYRVRW